MIKPSRTAHELFAESLRLLLAKDMIGYAGLWAFDGLIEFPFAAPNYPTRLEGRVAIEDYLRGYPDLLDVREITEQTVHETHDPDVVVAEFEAAGVAVATARPYRIRYVAVLTARNGEIVSYRDYWSPLAGAEILGGLDLLTAAFAGWGVERVTRATVLIIGGTGTTGRLLAALLRERATTMRIGTRTPTHGRSEHVGFEWAEPVTYGPAVAGVDRIYLIAPLGVAEPAPLVEKFLAEAVRAGVRRVVLLSSSAVADGTSGLGALPPLVRTSVPEWAVLRPSWFMQNFVGRHPVADGIRASREIVTATGEGRVGFIDAADIAAVAARALLDPEPHNTDHLLTGPEALSYADAAAAITDTTGQMVRHRAISAAEMTSRLVGAGLSPEFATVLADLDEGIRHGAEDRVASTVQDVTGRPGRSFREFVSANRDAFTA